MTDQQNPTSASARVERAHANLDLGTPEATALAVADVATLVHLGLLDELDPSLEHWGAVTLRERIRQALRRLMPTVAYLAKDVPLDDPGRVAEALKPEDAAEWTPRPS